MASKEPFILQKLRQLRLRHEKHTDPEHKSRLQPDPKVVTRTIYEKVAHRVAEQCVADVVKEVTSHCKSKHRHHSVVPDLPNFSHAVHTSHPSLNTPTSPLITTRIDDYPTWSKTATYAKRIYDNLTVAFGSGQFFHLKTSHPHIAVGITSSLRHIPEAGMILFCDPSTDTKLRCKLTVSYGDQSTEAAAWSDGNPYAMDLTNVISTPDAPEQAACVSLKRNLPGWNGHPPLWIPASYCKLQLSELTSSTPLPSAASGVITSELSLTSVPETTLEGELWVGVFSCSSLQEALRLLGKYIHNYKRVEKANVPTMGKFLPLNLAVLRGDILGVRRLLENGANPNLICAASQNSALHEAILLELCDIAQWLVNHGANVTVIDGHGNTPLHLASQKSNLALLRILLIAKRCKQALQIKNKKGKTPLHMCSQISARTMITGAQYICTVCRMLNK